MLGGACVRTDEVQWSFVPWKCHSGSCRTFSGCLPIAHAGGKRENRTCFTAGLLHDCLDKSSHVILRVCSVRLNHLSGQPFDHDYHFELPTGERVARSGRR